MQWLRLGRLFRFICNVLAHRPALPWPIHNAFRIFAPKGLGDVVAPANGQMRFKYLWKFLDGNLTPLQGFLSEAQQRGPMIMPVNLVDRFTAIRARSAPIPLLGNTPHRASLRIVFNLAETFLSATLALWPAGTLVEMNTYVFCPPSASNIP